METKTGTTDIFYFDERHDVFATYPSAGHNDWCDVIVADSGVELEVGADFQNSSFSKGSIGCKLLKA